MKILYFSGTKLPSQNAQSVHCIKMAEAFARHGHDVTLFAKSVPEVEIDEIFKAYNTEKLFKLELSSYLSIPLLSGAIRWIDVTGKIRRMEKPDIIYGSDLSALSMLSSIGAKIVYEANSLPETSSKFWALQKLIQHENFVAIIVTSDLLKQDFLDKYNTLNDEKIFVAYDGAELINQISCAPSPQPRKILLNGRSNALKVGYMGSLHAGKGIDMISQIAELRPEYEFHVIGGVERHLQKYDNENYLPNLHFYGHRNHSDIPSYLEAFDVVIAPYQHNSMVRTDKNITRWLSPIKIFEYMAAKKPIICSNMPVLQEILQDKHNSLLVPDSDENAWTKALDLLHKDPALAKKLGENAYIDLTKKYTWDKRTQAILEFIRDMPLVFKQTTARAKIASL